MKRILLTRGKFALVDDEDYDWLNQWKWCAAKQGRRYYATRNTPYVDRRQGKPPSIFMHRLIMNTPDGKEVDHKNHNAIDNRKINLRICTRSENMANVRPGVNSASRYKGVSRTGRQNQTWRSRIMYHRKTIYLGFYFTEIEAAKAYDVKAKELFGEFAYTNF